MEETTEKKTQDNAVTPQAVEQELVEKKDPTIITPEADEPIPSSGSAKNSK